MKTIIIAYGAAIIAAALATPAMSITVPSGTYSGTSVDGNSVSFVVGTDTNTGEQAVTAATIFFSAPCGTSGYTLNTGWGIGVTDDIHPNGKVTINVSGSYYRFVITLAFTDVSGSYGATGTVLTNSPTLYPLATPPTHALMCTSPKQALSVTLQSSDAAQRELAPGTRINLNSPRASDNSSVEASH